MTVTELQYCLRPWRSSRYQPQHSPQSRDGDSWFHHRSLRKSGCVSDRYSRSLQQILRASEIGLKDYQLELPVENLSKASHWYCVPSKEIYRLINFMGQKSCGVHRAPFRPKVCDVAMPVERLLAFRPRREAFGKRRTNQEAVGGLFSESLVPVRGDPLAEKNLWAR